MKRDFGSLTLADAMRIIPAERFTSWTPEIKPQDLSDLLLDRFRRFQPFDLKTDAGKLLLIDALLAEVVPKHAFLKVWKCIFLDSAMLSGCAEYLITPDYAYLKAPLLCVEQAKLDDFVMGATRCIAEMAACRANNRDAGLNIDIYGIVSNGNFWQFYLLTTRGTIDETTQYGLNDLPLLLGMPHSICAACASNVPS